MLRFFFGFLWTWLHCCKISLFQAFTSTDELQDDELQKSTDSASEETVLLEETVHSDSSCNSVKPANTKQPLKKWPTVYTLPNFDRDVAQHLLQAEDGENTSTLPLRLRRKIVNFIFADISQYTR